MTKRFVVSATAVIAGLAAAAGAVLAGGIPTSAPVMTYSGVMRDGNGNPLADVDKILQLKLWPESTPSGDALCAIPPTAITTDSLGHFSIPLDPCLDTVRENSELHIEVIVGTVSLGTAKLGAVPYAVEAAHAEEAAHAYEASTANSARAVSGASVRISKDCTFIGGAHTDCKCEAGEIAISGGACSAGCGVSGWLAESMRVNDDPTIWRVSCANSSASRVRCASEFAVCLKSGS